ncbi:hypothetical protein OF83DRAFT_1108195 [Amylostereum chailletii]|nr:hypothetical protein OF83DRAFT_1108195 [Amylostereum chailletii]
MSLAPSPSATRGDLILQPNFFTSSLFVDSFRADIDRLVSLFCQRLEDAETNTSGSGSNSTHFIDAARASTAQPFTLFKRVWEEDGWTWLHFKTFDARTRWTYLRVVYRLFIERMEDTEPSLTRVAALFALCTFSFTQPNGSHPPLHTLNQIQVSSDVYESLLQMPLQIHNDPATKVLAPFVRHILSKLLLQRVFHILPRTSLEPHAPRTLPREVFVSDNSVPTMADEESTGEIQGPKAPKKKGRPTRRDVQKRAREAVATLDRWLDKTGATGPSAKHSLLSEAPVNSRTTYVEEKTRLLDALDCGAGEQALIKANSTVVGRLRRIDEKAAEKGMEVGSEGGERTGLGRVERAAAEVKKATERRGGILGLLEGAGLEDG